MRNLLLIGANFTNKGAEAMVVTAITHFHKYYPHCRITVASYSHNEQIPYGEHIHPPGLEDSEASPFEFIRNPRLHGKIRDHFFRMLAWRMLPSAFGWSAALRAAIFRPEPYLQRLAQSDLIVDLSGFAMSDQRSFRRRMVFCFELLTSRWMMGKPFIIFTQALGPFQHLSSRILAKLCLPQASLILARGRRTLEHLRDIGISPQDEIPVCADSAFLFSAATPERADSILADALAYHKPLFGIIPNIRVLGQMLPADGHNPYIRLLVCLCDYTQAELQSTPVLLSHSSAEDTWLIDEIIKQSQHPDHIAVISPDHTASEFKAVIRRFDFLVASRFHSVVAAISTGTPFLVVGWAHKYEELVADIGMEAYVFNAQNMDQHDFFAALQKAWEQRTQIRQQLERHAQALRISAENAFRLVAERWP